MLSSRKYKSILNLEAKYDIFHEILSSFNRKMDFYFTTVVNGFLCFQITWLLFIATYTGLNKPGFIRSSFGPWCASTDETINILLIIDNSCIGCIKKRL
jgi:hypothetical protein